MLFTTALPFWLFADVVFAATYQGFSYGSTFTDNTPKSLQDFTDEFNTARSLEGTSSKFTSARLFTMIQAGTPDKPTAAIEAAINTGTSLLLGLWASAGPIHISVELAALEVAIQNYGQRFTDLIVGISVGSEDLYRMSPLDTDSQAGLGASPEDVVTYINSTRSLIAGTSAANVPVGHVDTWTAWVNSSNAAVIEACDFIGMDGYPYFQSSEANSVDVAKALLFEAFAATAGVAGDRPVWITETGWPVSGPVSNQAVANVENAEKYWNQVGCAIFGQISTWWYTLQDAFPTAPTPSFGILGNDLSDMPLYNLSCSESSSTTLPTANASQSASVVSASTAAPITTSTTAPATSMPSGCGTALTGSYEFPHLIVPIHAEMADEAFGNGYDGHFSRSISTLFNFDIPESTSGQVCTLVFLFPTVEQMPAANYNLSGAGNLYISRLMGPASQDTTWNTTPEVAAISGTIYGLEPGNKYVLGAGTCPAGRTIGIEVSGAGSLDLTYFQESSAPGIGLYITIC